MVIKISRTRLDFGTVGMKNYAETVQALGNVSGTINLDYSSGSVVTATPTGTTTWNITNPPASGKTGSVTIVLTNGGSQTQNWMAGTDWPGGIAPTLTASGIDVLTFFTTDAGTTWRGDMAISNIPLDPTTGRLWGWGQDANGQLGDNQIAVNYSSPIQTGTLANWSKVAIGGGFTLAVKTDGTLWTWGINSNSGQLGDGTTTNRSSPVRIGTLVNWANVSAGRKHAVAYRTDGTLWAWGRAAEGQIGDSQTAANRSSPTQVGTLTIWSGVSAGNYHSLAVRTDGTLWSWGLASSGQLGNSQTAANASSPVQVGNLTTWSMVSAGYLHSLAKKTDGTLWSWGFANFGSIGDNTSTTKSSPVQIGGLTTWSGVSAGGCHSLAYKTDGTLWAWGNNASGQVGDNTSITRLSPVQIGGLTTWSGVAGGYSHSLAYKTDGTLWAWGDATVGQVGNNQTVVNKSSPVQVGTLTTWSKAASGPISNSSFGIR